MQINNGGATLIDNLVEEKLTSRAQGGSKPRCHRITQGTRDVVADRLTTLIHNWGAVSRDDTWMPVGFEDTTEAQLHRHQLFSDFDVRRELQEWWFAKVTPRSLSPNFDIVSTCTIYGVKGLLLVEAKAHVEELTKEVKGKSYSSSSIGSIQNHDRIGECIVEANSDLIELTSLKWGLSRDSHYQLSNRFAWSWKLLQLGVPIILVYLGFLNANEMGVSDRIGKNMKVLPDHQTWSNLVYDHSSKIVPKEVWNSKIFVHGQSFVPLIRSIEIPFDEPIGKFLVKK